jgi:hypothetical protein
MNDKENADVLNILAKAIVQTDEFSDIIQAFAPEAMDRWSGRNWIKRGVGKFVKKSIKKGFSKKSGKGEGKPLESMSNDPEFIRSIMEGLPSLINILLESGEALTSGMVSLPDDEKELLLGNFIERIDIAKTGRGISNIASVINHIHNNNEIFFAEKIRPAVREWLEETDFGEIKEMVDNSVTDIVSSVKMINEEMWQYPGKAICLMTAIPSVLNIIFKSLSETITPLNNNSPDLLVDVTLTVIKEIRGEWLGELINEINEIVRKIHTGSALLGEHGNPRLPKDISRFVDDTLKAVDVELMLKTKSMLNEIKESISYEFSILMNSNPEIYRNNFHGRFRSAASSVQLLSRSIENAEDMFTDEELVEEIKNGLSEIDPQVLADIISRAGYLLNRVHSIEPEMLHSLLTQFTGSLNIDELGESVKWIVDDIAESLKPVSNTVMPHLVNGFVELLTPDKKYGDTGEMDKALLSLRKLLTGGKNAK